MLEKGEENGVAPPKIENKKTNKQTREDVTKNFSYRKSCKKEENYFFHGSGW